MKSDNIDSLPLKLDSTIQSLPLLRISKTGTSGPIPLANHLRTLVAINESKP